MFLIVYVANNRPPACPQKFDNYIIYVLTLSVIDLQVFVYTQEWIKFKCGIHHYFKYERQIRTVELNELIKEKLKYWNPTFTH